MVITKRVGVEISLQVLGKTLQTTSGRSAGSEEETDFVEAVVTAEVARA